MRIARDLYVDECHTSSKEKIPTVQTGDTFPVKGAIVYNTDTDSIWFGNGSDWAPMGSAAQITAVESTGMPPGTFGIECTPNPITGIGTIALADIPTVTPGDYTSANIRIDQQGRITLASNGSGGGGSGVTLIEAIPSTGMPPGTFGIECTPNPITGIGTIALADTSVAPGTYTNANIRVDQQGRLTFAENGSTVPTYPLAPMVSFSGTVNTNGTSTFPGASVVRSPGSASGAGTFKITGHFTKQQIAPSRFVVTLSFNVSIIPYALTEAGHFTFTINSNPAGFNFPPNTFFNPFEFNYAAWTPYYTGTFVPDPKMQSKMRFRFVNSTQVVAVSAWIGPIIPVLNLPTGNDVVPVEMDTIDYTYYTNV